MPLAGQRDDSWTHIRDAIPHRHIIAFAAVTEELRAFRRGDGEAVDRLAEALADQLGPTECLVLRDAAELARRTLPPTGWKMADWLRAQREARS